MCSYYPKWRADQNRKVEILINQQLKHLNVVFRQVPPQDAFLIDGVKEIGCVGSLVMFEIRRGLGLLMEKAVPYGIIDIESKNVSSECNPILSVGSHEAISAADFLLCLSSPGGKGLLSRGKQTNRSGLT